MELGPLRSFLEVAREGNMTRAAERLGLTQPAISGQLARLEAELGQMLFDRTPRGMLLTPAGSVFREHAERALRALEDGRTALLSLAGLERGSLSIGGGATATTYLLPPLLGRFHELHPAIRIFVREQGSQSVADAVAAGELDLGVVTEPIRQRPGPGRLAVEPWVEDELLLIVPPDHRLRRRKTFRWADLEGDALVLFEAGTAVRALIDRRLAAAGLHTETVMELRSIESIKQMVAQGIGAGFVSRFAVGPRQHTLACREGALKRRLALIYPQGRSPAPAARTFLELMRRRRPRPARGSARRARRNA